MKLDIERGVINWLYRLVMSFVPVRKGPVSEALSKRTMGWRYGHGNIFIQMGRMVFDDEYGVIRNRALTHEFSF